MNSTQKMPHPAEAMILARTSPTVIERAQRIRLMAFDVDGVLTDGRLWYSEQGEAVKSFHVLDGHGLRLLGENGITVALVTGREGVIVPRRAAELGISLIYQNARDKAAVLSELAQAEGLESDQIGFMGDDIIDMHAMQRAGFAASVPGAPGYVTQIAHWVSTAPGGGGAARECCDLLLAAQGKLGACLQAGVSRLAGGIQ